MAAASASRPAIVGPDAGPEQPYPLRLEGVIIQGFGRGSKELGIPTANIPVDGLELAGRRDFESGIYFGWAGLRAPRSVHRRDGDAAEHCIETYPMVMSVGWNPYYRNEKRSVEVHLIHSFPEDFYGAHLRLLTLAFVRPERGDYPNTDALIADIKTDIDVARDSLARPAWASYRHDAWLVQ